MGIRNGMSWLSSPAFGFLRNQGDEWVFRMEMAAIFHKFIVGSRVWDLKVSNEKKPCI